MEELITLCQVPRLRWHKDYVQLLSCINLFTKSTSSKNPLRALVGKDYYHIWLTGQAAMRIGPSVVKEQSSFDQLCYCLK